MNIEQFNKEIERLNNEIERLEQEDKDTSSIEIHRDEIIAMRDAIL